MPETRAPESASGVAPQGNAEAGPADDEGPAGAQLPADPVAYDSARAVQARARGLAAPYIAGGNDPDPETGRREERRYLSLLLIMVVVIVLSGFVLGYLALLLGFQA